ncbi:MAG: YncE family protein, partial [Geodermatophilaceae bacterium]|nr:YncE family protein [Geodermatophilaceae bacterium]
AGCASDPAVPEGPGAAEPGRSPELVVDPAGTVQPLAAQPEGMVYDAETGILAVAVREPNRLLLVDGASGEVRVEVALPGHARHLQLAGPGGPVLVPAEDSDVFVQVSLPGGEVAETSVGDYPHDAATTPDGLTLVADERGGTLSVLDGTDVVHTFDDVQQPGGVTAVGELAAVVDVGAFTLSTYDLDAKERLGVLDAGEGPTHLVADGQGRLVVADTRGSEMLVFTADPLALQMQYPLPGTPYGLAWNPDAETLWVTLTARNEVVALDLSGVEPVETGRFPTVRQPNTVAVDPVSGRVWVASRTTGDLQMIDP